MMFIATSLLLNSCSNDEFELENLESNKKLSLKDFQIMKKVILKSSF
ncbi:Uncharacterised protein [Weeksella virosa]|uniref:Uncharacterized protein n=1 Tax=Weeksella virosa (strain ATCC 43766 / DSM 16922 / JCM 21250 / CCUG 30538 / CDC 9751 / IAM 14551 / NBRC 16016 / NCTC 11634 / CL345/78) TaxID=865938 RepID=F0P1I9_WEEVC|nr:hypothetical protein Weevi_0906 [Weeksella virosa DSM 16922]SUP53918.1 Uncharacterised protein [Weeksella virosa]VEH64759.1 Uncharacterised protein [Weeksella virosa]